MSTLRYRENAQSEWKNIVVLKGDKGDTGERGEQGPAGAPGAQGPKGDPGETLIDNYTLVKSSSGVISVNTTNEAQEDNTRPITSAGVHTIVGNIDALLSLI